MKARRATVVCLMILGAWVAPLRDASASHEVCNGQTTDSGDSWVSTGDDPPSSEDPKELSNSRNIINTQAGLDRVHANGGHDLICGAPDSDFLVGGDDKDHLRGNLHADFLQGNGDSDVLRGASGFYGWILGGGGSDELYDGVDPVNCLEGGEGNDKFWDGYQGDPDDGLHDCLYGQGGSADTWFACPLTSDNDFDGIEIIYSNVSYCDDGNT